MLPKYKLAMVFFLSTLSILLLLFTALYWYSVPLIKKEIYQVELNASRLVLNNVFELANKMHFNLKTYEQEAINAHKRNLNSVISLTENHIQQMLTQAERNGISQPEAFKQFFSDLRSYQYGNNDYIWVANKDYLLLSHPDPRFHQTNASQLKDAQGELIIPRLINDVINKGEGFYRYTWHRLGEVESVEKISYVKYFPQWDFFIGTGVYLDDVKLEVQHRRDQAVEELRQALEEIVIAQTGYLFVFDDQGNMLAHPNPNIDKTNALTLKNPVSGHSILQELKNVADTGNELEYKWDRPTDQNHYIYDKISLVRHLEGFDWYICSSVYVDELQASSKLLSQRIMNIGLLALLIAIALAFWFSKWITRPISKLAHISKKVSQGDLTVKANLNRQDELGILANTFDDMVGQLKQNIDTLDSTVEHRTQELQKAVLDTQIAQQQLALVESRQRRILEAMPAQISYLDSDLNYLFANQKYCELFALHEDIVGLAMEDVIGANVMADIRCYLQKCLAGEEVIFNYTFNSYQNNQQQEILTQCVLIPDWSNYGDKKSGKVIGLLKLTIDITAEKQAQMQLAEAQRMNSVGQLAGGLAHDFNNILTIVMGNLSVLKNNLADSPELINYIDPALRASKRGGEITSRLLAFSRRQSLMPERIEVQHSIKEVLTLIRGSLTNSINLKYAQLSPQLCFSYLDEGQFENCLINLILNAKDAITSENCAKGEISIFSQPIEIKQDDTFDNPVLSGPYIQVIVQDNGTGFSLEAIRKGFEPFFTTKINSGLAAGSGLGLSMVYGFVKQSKGYIKLENLPDHQGARVVMLLPEMPDEETQIITKDITGTSLANNQLNEEFDGKLILLVEDNDDVRDIVRKQLLNFGFNIIEAQDADEAESLINSLSEIYALISDISMPGKLNGIELAQLFKAKNKTSHTILMTGYAFDQSDSSLETDKLSIQRIIQALDIPLLQKPFSIETLIKHLL